MGQNFLFDVEPSLPKTGTVKKPIEYEEPPKVEEPERTDFTPEEQALADIIKPLRNRMLRRLDHELALTYPTVKETAEKEGIDYYKLLEIILKTTKIRPNMSALQAMNFGLFLRKEEETPKKKLLIRR